MMKNNLFTIWLKITLASFLCLFIYVFFSAVLIAPIAAIPIVWLANLVLSLVLAAIFSAILIMLQYKKNLKGEKIFWDDFPEGTRYSVKEDVKKIIAREKHVFIIIISIILSALLAILIDELLHVKLLRNIFLIYSPLYSFFSLFDGLPLFFELTFGFVFSCFATNAVYIAVTLLFHRKWYKKYRP